jgi:hypothetical protein
MDVEGIKLPIDTLLMSFIEAQAEEAHKSQGYDIAGLLDIEEDTAYAQLTKVQISKTKKALRQLLSSHAGQRRLAAILSIAIKASVDRL